MLLLQGSSLQAWALALPGSLGEEPLANRWRQLSRRPARSPAASQGPDISATDPPPPPAQESGPGPSPVSLSPPRSPLLSGRAPEPPRSLRPSTTPAVLWRCAGITHFCIQVCMHSTHTRACHMPTRSCAHTTHSTHTHLHVCAHLHTFGSTTLQKKPCVCVCVCDTYILVGTWVSAHTSTGKLEGCRRHR